MRVTILGAGDMGTALATPLAANGHEVRLWGTPLDADIVAMLRVGEPHPRLRTYLPAGAWVFGGETGAWRSVNGQADPSDDDAGAAEALDGADLVVLAVTSTAVRSVVERLAPHLAAVPIMVTVAKGFDRNETGRAVILPEVIRERYAGHVVAVGGPSKANEVAAGRPTAVVFAGDRVMSVSAAVEAISTAAYHPISSNDVVGVEIAAAMKNAYAIAMGVADGLEQRHGVPHHNLKAALFPRAVEEMAALAEAVGGHAATVRGLAGSGDLQVTITSGRNRLLGEGIGLTDGEPGGAQRAAENLMSGGTTVEGYHAVDFGFELATEAVDMGRAAAGSFPVLNALHGILHMDAVASEALWVAVRGGVSVGV